MPLTLLTTPLKLERLISSPSEAIVGLGISGPAASQDYIPQVIIKKSDLPHSRSINLMTLSLRLKLDTLSVTLDLLQVSSGRLSITCGDMDTLGKGDRIIDVNNIPTTTDLQL